MARPKGSKDSKPRKTRTKPGVPGTPETTVGQPDVLLPPLPRPKAPAKAKKAAQAAPAARPQLGHNGPPLEEEASRRALFNRDRDQYNRKLGEKKRVDSEFRDVCKLITKSSGPLQIKMIRFANTISMTDGERDMAERLEGQLEVARWMGAPLGTQFALALVTPDGIDRARQVGEAAGEAGQPCRPPPEYIPGQDLYRAWTEGWADGQAKLYGGVGRSPDQIMEQGPADLQ